MLTVLLAVALAQEEGGPLRWALEGDVRYGRARGYIQIPRGGRPGSTSARRPRLGEIGIETVVSPAVTLRIGWYGFETHVGYRWLRLSGRETVAVDLVSHGRVFPAGTSVRSRVRLDTLRFGFAYRFRIPVEPGELEIAPRVGGVALYFDYRLDGSGGQAARRAFPHLTYGAGLALAWTLESGLFFEADAHATAPWRGKPSVVGVAGYVGYRARLAPGGELRLRVGVGWDTIRFEDTQSGVHNKVRVDMGPLVTAGLDARW